MNLQRGWDGFCTALPNIIVNSKIFCYAKLKRKKGSHAYRDWL